MKWDILLLDLETSPFLGYTWGKYEQNVIKFTQNSQIICISWKWLHHPETYAMAQCDTKGYKAGKLNDKELVKALWELLDKALVVIAHNGDRFDVKVANARFTFYNLPPPSPYRTIDTKKVAKRIGMFPSNKLGDLGPYFGQGEKIETGGFGLWEECMAGKASAWKKMKLYNKQDVILLEKVYIHLLPWITNHPNLNVLLDTERNCKNCGGHKVHKRGFNVTQTGKRQNFQCRECGAWSMGPLIKRDKAMLR